MLTALAQLFAPMLVKGSKDTCPGQVRWRYLQRGDVPFISQPLCLLASVWLIESTVDSISTANLPNGERHIYIA